MLPTHILQTFKHLGHPGVNVLPDYRAGSFRKWHNTYTITRPDVDALPLGAYVNSLAQAEQFITPGAVTRATVFDLDPGDELHPFTPAHFFIDRTQLPQALGVYPGIRLGGTTAGLPLDLMVSFDRRLGKAARRQFRAVVTNEDLYLGAPKQYAPAPLVLDAKSNLNKWFAAWYIYLSKQLPGVDVAGSWQGETAWADSQDRAGPLRITGLTFDSGRYRNENADNNSETTLRVILERAMTFAGLSLTLYDDAMKHWGLNWGDGYFPDLAGAVFYMRLACGVWWHLARALGIHFDDMLGRGVGDGITFSLGLQVDFSHPVTIHERDGIPRDCISELWMLARHERLHPFPIPAKQPCSVNFPVTQGDGSCMRYPLDVYPQFTHLHEAFWNQSKPLYDRMDELTRWLFAVQNVLCVLDSTFRIKHPPRRTSNASRRHYHSKDVVFPGPYQLRHFGAANRARESLAFDLRYPVMTEIVPQDRGPFLAFHQIPQAPPKRTGEAGGTVPPVPLKKRCPFQWNPTTDYDNGLDSIYQARAINQQRGCKEDERARYEQHINLKLSDAEWNWVRVSNETP